MAGQQRRLAAIVAMDVAGYSRLMGRNEHTTLNRLNEHRAAIDPIGLEHGGRIVGTAGDGILIEFPSVVEAVNFGLRCQAIMAERNADIPDDEKMLFRIGINLGDVLVQDDDLFGDGVNVAARIEALAEPGGICISRAARDQIRDKLEAILEDQGEVEVKNIARPVRIFRLSADKDVVAAIKPIGVISPQVASARGGNWKLITTVAALLLILILAGGSYWWWQQQTDEIDMALPDKPSIAVLPFDNLSDDPKQEYFANGMAEDIITDLSKISGLFVIARNSSFSYKGQKIDIKAVGRELGVRYVLEGSVRRAGDQLRINAQLIDASTGGHMWAERYDGTLADVFALQDQISKRIINALSVTLNEEEQRVAVTHETEIPEAHDAFLNGWRYYLNRTPEGYAAALPWLEKAVELDPEYGRAWAALAWLYSEALAHRWHTDLNISVTRIPELIKQAKARPTALIYQLLGKLIAYGQFDKSMAAFDTADALEPNNSDNVLFRAIKMDFFGRPAEAIKLAQKAIRLDPLYGSHSLYALGRAQYSAGNFNEAIQTLKRGIERNPQDQHLHVFLIAAYMGAGQIDTAKQAVKALNAKWSETKKTPLWIRDFYSLYDSGGTQKVFMEHLIAAGVPERLSIGDYQLSSKDLMVGDELEFRGVRIEGILPQGVWAEERYMDGKLKFFWNKKYIYDGRYHYENNQSISEHFGGPRRFSICDVYRNKNGNRESRNEYIKVCEHGGIYPISVLPHEVSQN